MTEKERPVQELHYPKEGKTETANYLLRTQLMVCVLLLLVIAIMGRLCPEKKQKLLEEYQTYLEQYSMDPRQEVLRFAQSLTEQVPIPAMGGSRQKQQPENYSEQTYLPERTIAQPLESYWVTSGYGWRDDPLDDGKDFHTGIDLAAGQGTPIGAALAGTVLKAGYSKSYGNYILVSHGQEEFTLYAHLQYLFVRVGQQVKQGQTLGTVGATGAATGPHLHFELFHLDTGYDPAEALGL